MPGWRATPMPPFCLCPAIFFAQSLSRVGRGQGNVNLRFFFPSCLLVGFAASELATAAPAPNHETLRVTEKILYRFKGGSDGAHPESGVVMDSAGNLYGTTYGTRFSGSKACRACGTIFEISAHSRTETLLHAFSGENDGAYPTAGLIPSWTVRGTCMGQHSMAAAGAPPPILPGAAPCLRYLPIAIRK